MSIDNLKIKQADTTFLMNRYPLKKIVNTPSVHGAAGSYQLIYLHEIVEQLKSLNKKILKMEEKKEGIE